MSDVASRAVWPQSRSDISCQVSTTDQAYALSLGLLSDDPPSNGQLNEIIILEEESMLHSCHYVTGSTRHVFRDRSAFETYESIEPLSVDGHARYASDTAIGLGTVRVQAVGQCAARTSGILLRDVLHIPSSNFNIVSGGRLDIAGLTARLGNNLVTLSLRGSTIVDGSVCAHRLFRLNIDIIRHPYEQSRSEPPHRTSQSRPLAATGRGGISVD
jgi:hypothetical protein